MAGDENGDGNVGKEKEWGEEMSAWRERRKGRDLRKAVKKGDKKGMHTRKAG